MGKYKLRALDSFISVHKYLCSRYNHIIKVLYTLTHKIHETVYFCPRWHVPTLGSKTK